MSIRPNDPADFTPSMGSYTELKPFRFWCQKILPLVYDDSLSYYELLCKVVDYLNKAMEDVDTLHGDVTNLHNAYEQLQGYVNDYFADLDVQEEINSKLDEMAEDGSLSDLIAPFIPDLVSAWMSEHITPTTPVIDDTLSVQGAGADSKKVGDEINDLKYAMDNNVLQYRGATTRPVSELPTGIYSVAKQNTDVIGLPVGMVSNYGTLIKTTTVEGYLLESSTPMLMWRWTSGNWYTVSDSSLSKAGYFADAKVVGDNLFVYHGTTTNFETAKPGIWSFARTNVASYLPENFSTNYGYLMKMNNTPDYQTWVCIESRSGVPTMWMKIVDGEWFQLNNYNVPGILEDKKIAFIGDSITEYNATASYNYVKLFEVLEKSIVQNLGRSGVGYCRYHETNMNFINKISEIDSDTDYIVVAGSFNDLGCNEPLGTPTDTGTDTICGYINTFYDTILTNFPATQIFVFTMNYWESFGTNNDRYFNYVNALEAICKTRAIPFVDVGKQCGIRAWDSANKTALCPDGTHPNNAGHLRLYPVIKNTIIDHIGM